MNQQIVRTLISGPALLDVETYDLERLLAPRPAINSLVVDLVDHCEARAAQLFEEWTMNSASS